jgi:hypothetical protein
MGPVAAKRGASSEKKIELTRRGGAAAELGPDKARMG